MKAQLEPLIEPQGVSFVSRKIRQKRFNHPLHYHPQLELTYIIAGSGTRIVGDHIEPFGPGDLCLLGENLPHCYHQPQASRKQSRAEVLHFNRDCGNGILDHTGEFYRLSLLLEKAQYGLHFSKSTGSEVVPLMVQLRESQGLLAWQLFLEICQRLLDDQKLRPLASGGIVDHAKHAPSRRIHKACQYLLDHHTEDLSHEAVARYVHMAPASFSRLFKKATQMSYTEFLLQVRLGSVCRLLRETDKSVTEAAFASGFHSLAHFNRQFKKRYGCSPTQYRQIT